jgi:cell division septation protein DedD
VLSDQVPYYIIDLLQQSPSVDIRGLGRFEAIFHPAVVDNSASQIKPPFLRPGFEAIDVPQHGLLSQYISYVSGASPSVADQAIDDFVQRVVNETASGQVYEVEQFGAFAKTENNTIRFTPDWDAFNLSFRGLDVIDLQDKRPEYKPAEQEITAPEFSHADSVVISSPVIASDPIPEPESKINLVPEILPVEPSNRTGIEESTSRLWWIILISALFLITVLCGYLAWDILSNRNKLNDIAAVIPDSTSVAQPGDATQIIDSSVIEVKPLPIDTQELPPAESKPDPTPTPPKSEPPKSTGEYCYVVVGAFADPDNITRMEKQLADLGYTSELLKGRTITRVAIRTSCDKDSLHTILNTARATINPEAWIY